MSVRGPDVSFEGKDQCPDPKISRHSPDNSSHLATSCSLQKEHAVGMNLKRETLDGFAYYRSLFLESNHYFYFIYVLFLMRGRKRTKKKRALRQGAGFSVNHSGGINGSWAACQLFSCTSTNAMDGSARKNPPYPPSLERKNLLLCETYPLPEGRRKKEEG